VLIEGTENWFRGIKGDGFEISIEYNEDLVFVHLDECTKMTAGVFKELKRFMASASTLFQTVGYLAVFTVVPNDRPDILRLDKMLGFEDFHPYGDEGTVLIYRGE